MEIKLTNLSKKFVSNTLFKGLNATFLTNKAYAITGSNGSGKSTLLKIIAGYIAPSSGSVNFTENEILVPKDNHFQHINICAPYLDLVEEFTLAEHIEFHSKFKKVYFDSDLLEEIDKAQLSDSLNKPVQEFSSGMKQRLKIILATCYHSNVLLLDEPTSHLDKAGKEWYNELIKGKINERITLFFSNDEQEFTRFTDNLINIEQLK
ncbi:ATP-binding cassette domain-containing protein [Marivirga sp. S37H4]|uniref:ATP-binding cassette domain-containing protein n=1 Tax=Marivirga aurantiaca TaxID=2802615 RepID=A0A934WVW4_9BACT|nr:ATP-binding cassette domain-containing protein [Marivirga aurantiaca]MBK6263881.1 ATP-binding cassette domain-containing protein [Marivirga aurantiaca]